MFVLLASLAGGVDLYERIRFGDPMTIGELGIAAHAHLEHRESIRHTVGEQRGLAGVTDARPIWVDRSQDEGNELPSHAFPVLRIAGEPFQ